MEAGLQTDQQIERALPSLSNWGRWGNDDQLGTLNHITPQRRAAGCIAGQDSARRLARPAGESPETDRSNAEFTRSRGDPAAAARDFIGLVFHGFSVTHLDALCHVSDGRELYNGYPTSWRTAATRVATSPRWPPPASSAAVCSWISPRCAEERLSAGDAITPQELDAALERAAVEINPGDILWIRTGLGTANTREGRAGLHADCLPWLRDREVALLGSDGDSDAWPSPLDDWASPIHSVGIWKLGLPLIDNAELDPLAAACERQGRWSFMCAVSAAASASGRRARRSTP